VGYDVKVKRTRAKRVIRLLKLFAWGIILALGRDALEVVGIVLEAGIVNEYGDR